MALLILQITYGGMTAGLKAGHVSDTWPLMFGKLIPPRLFNSWINLFEMPADHRLHPSLAGMAWADCRACCLLLCQETKLPAGYPKGIVVVGRRRRSANHAWGVDHSLLREYRHCTCPSGKCAGFVCAGDILSSPVQGIGWNKELNQKGHGFTPCPFLLQKLIYPSQPEPSFSCFENLS